jgi:hypothetical protein
MTFRYRWNPGGPLFLRAVQHIVVRVKRRRREPLCPGQSEWVLQQPALSPRHRLHPHRR